MKTSEKTVKKSKKKSLFLIITASVVACIAVVSLVLGLITTKGLNDFSDYSSVTVKNSSGQIVTILRTDVETDENEDQYYVNGEFKKALKTTRYSVLRGIMEGTFKNSYKFLTEDNTYEEWNDDGTALESVTRTERVEVARGNILSSVAPVGEEYTVTFKFDRADNGDLKKSITIEKETLYFDTAVFKIKVDASNIIENYTLYLYDSEKMTGVENESYSINPITINAKAFKLYESIKDVIFPYFNI